MNINKVGLMPYACKSQSFGNNKSDNEYENPVSRSMERNLAILETAGSSAILGLVAWGLSSGFQFQNKNVPRGIGAAVAALTLLLLLPSNLYNTKVRAFTRQKEMDVFTRDRSLKTNLTEDVDKEVQDKNVSLDKKLDDNLKLQMANRGNAIGIINPTGESQTIVQPKQAPQEKAQQKHENTK